MPDATTRNFGLAIAFLCPGFVGLWSLSYFVPEIRTWMATAANAPTSVGSFLFALIASIAVGVFVSGARYFLFDLLLMRLLGVTKPKLDHGKRAAPGVEATVQTFIENHYRYYQFYANTAIALAALALVAGFSGRALLALAAAQLFLVLSARNCLATYHEKLEQTIGERPILRAA